MHGQFHALFLYALALSEISFEYIQGNSMIEGIRVFDTILSKGKGGDTVVRNAADYWRPFCAASGWAFNHERIHSLADIEYFFCKQTIKEDVIIFSGHGSDEDGFYLSNNERLDLNYRISVKEKNRKKIIIFSSCLIGNNRKLSIGLKGIFDAKILFSYRHVMYDTFCYLNESILLTMINDNANQNFTENNFRNFTKETGFMKNMNQKGVRTHPMKMF